MIGHLTRHSVLKPLHLAQSSEGSTFEHHTPIALFVTRVGGIDTPGDYYAVTADGHRFTLNNPGCRSCLHADHGSAQLDQRVEALRITHAM
jgi:hypothetical protein